MGIVGPVVGGEERVAHVPPGPGRPRVEGVNGHHQVPPGQQRLDPGGARGLQRRLALGVNQQRGRQIPALPPWEP